MPITMMDPKPSSRNRIEMIDEIRYRALARLHARREAVDALIRSLEAYQKTAVQVPRVAVSGTQRCWSDCAQSRI